MLRRLDSVPLNTDPISPFVSQSAELKAISSRKNRQSDFGLWWIVKVNSDITASINRTNLATITGDCTIYIAECIPTFKCAGTAGENHILGIEGVNIAAILPATV